ncbi:CobW family GTP-binding protein [Ampullimonas aquatilis]|uniref:CobW family GTP-binding protein n=1 Tax=Ampullimonas aquatilis TaxID=1341549 RepID=UPI003C785E42
MNPDNTMSSSSLGSVDMRIPVTLLTGFLGAGKTTLLNQLMSHPDMAGTAILINEFGEIGIDHYLVDKVDESLMILDSGCICCSVQGDLVRALKNLMQRSSLREIPPIKRILIETTGLADPVPVIYTLTQDVFIAARFMCDGVITVVDATHGDEQLNQYPEVIRQVATADRLLITKCDLADATAKQALIVRLSGFNPGAKKIEVKQGQIEPDLFFGCGLYSSVGKSADVAKWLGEIEEEKQQAGNPELNGAFNWTRKGSLSPLVKTKSAVRHQDNIRSFVITFDEAVSWYSFAVAMGRLLHDYGDRILRVKGLMNVIGDVKPYVIHCVQNVAYPPLKLNEWPQQKPFSDQRGRLVFITRDLTREMISTRLHHMATIESNIAAAKAMARSLALPTKCWLDHTVVPSAGASIIEHAGWVIQTKKLKTGS